MSYVDSQNRPIVVITGVGIVSSLGKGKEENWEKLSRGQSGIHTINRFGTEGLKTTVAGTVDFFDLDIFSAPALSYALAESAADEAVSESGLKAGDFPGPLFLAAPPVEMDWNHRFDLDAEYDGEELEGYSRMLESARKSKHEHMYELIQFGRTADKIADRFGTKGLPVSLSTACASGATAIQLGVEAIRRGESQSALCIGTDGSVTMEALIRFSLLSALTTQNEIPEKAAKPFSKDRDGFVMAEGAGALVLESLEHAKARGATVIAAVQGCGEKADDFHRTRSSPDGSPVIAAVNRALSDANITHEQVDYINAHGTSTPENDRMEYNSLKEVFGDNIHSTPISSNKSMIGHTLTAAGAIEAAFSALTIKHQKLPPTINYDTPDPDIPLDVVPEVARDAKVDTVLSNSFGFGGQNACLVLSRNFG